MQIRKRIQIQGFFGLESDSDSLSCIQDLLVVWPSLPPALAEEVIFSVASAACVSVKGEVRHAGVFMK